MLLSLYKANREWGGCSCHGPEHRSDSEHAVEEVGSVNEAVEWCVKRVVEDEQYSVRESSSDDCYAFAFIRAVTDRERAGCGFEASPTETYRGEEIVGDVCGQLVKFDLAYDVARCVKLIREEAVRRHKLATEEAERLRRERAAEEVERRRQETAAADKEYRRFQYEALKLEFEGSARCVPIEHVGVERLRVLLRDAGISPFPLDDAAVLAQYRERFGDSCVINSSAEDGARSGGA